MVEKPNNDSRARQVSPYSDYRDITSEIAPVLKTTLSDLCKDQFLQIERGMFFESYHPDFWWACIQLCLAKKEIDRDQAKYLLNDTAGFNELVYPVNVMFSLVGKSVKPFNDITNVSLDPYIFSNDVERNNAQLSPVRLAGIDISKTLKKCRSIKEIQRLALGLRFISDHIIKINFPVFEISWFEENDSKSDDYHEEIYQSKIIGQVWDTPNPDYSSIRKRIDTHDKKDWAFDVYNKLSGKTGLADIEESVHRTIIINPIGSVLNEHLDILFTSFLDEFDQCILKIDAFSEKDFEELINRFDAISLAAKLLSEIGSFNG